MTADDLDDAEEPCLPPRRFVRADMPVVALSFAHGMSSAVTEWLATVTNLAAGHANWVITQREFQDDIRRDLERLPETTTVEE